MIISSTHGTLRISLWNWAVPDYVLYIHSPYTLISLWGTHFTQFFWTTGNFAFFFSSFIKLGAVTRTVTQTGNLQYMKRRSNSPCSWNKFLALSKIFWWASLCKLSLSTCKEKQKWKQWNYPKFFRYCKMEIGQ